MNFGATLQAVSTYCYLKNNGYEPVFINYQSLEAQNAIKKGKDDSQWKTQLDFVNGIIKSQTSVCETSSQLIDIIFKENIAALIIGSDALLQHHPFLARIRKGRRRPIYIQNVASDRLFPNIFWGIGINTVIPTALMSVSSQNSEYRLFSPFTKKKMRGTLSKMKYISVRDTWTRDMVKNVSGISVPVTPDPVFSFNQNVGNLVPSKSDTIEKFGLSENYILLSLFEQVVSQEQIREIKKLFNEDGKELVILPMPTGGTYEFVADKEIKFPLSPMDWYALIKYSSGYIGSNMHPIVVCLHNAVPCFSLDIWGRTNFFNRKVDDGSSKVKHIMSVFGIAQNHRLINNGKCEVEMDEIFDAIKNFPYEQVKLKASEYLDAYNVMMQDILYSLHSYK
jgi:hypothetical protein